jgi:hypothetical protein
MLPRASSVEQGLNPELNSADIGEENIRSYKLTFWLANLFANQGLHKGEISKLGWLIGFVKHAMWADSFYFLYLLSLSISQNPSFVPAYPVTFFIGMLGKFGFV